MTRPNFVCSDKKNLFVHSLFRFTLMQSVQQIQLYPLMRIAVSMIIGILVGYAMEFPLWLPFVLFIAILLLSICLRRFIYWQGICVMLAAAALGCTLVSHKNDTLQTPPFSHEPHVYQAVLLSEPVLRGKVIRCDIMVTTGVWQDHRVKASILRDTVDNNYQRLHVGDGITAVSAMEEISNYNKSNFNYPLYLHSHGFTATTFISWNDWRKAVVNLTDVSRFVRAKLSLLKFRQQLINRIKTIGVSGQELAVAMAMTLGDKSMLSQTTRDIYAISGASHVLALSGLHLTIVYVILSMFLGGRRHVVREALLLAAIWAYVVMVGMPSSVVRAAIMITVYGIMSVANRNKMSLNTLALAAIIMLISNPLCIFDIGFQLSFLSVLSILILYPVFISLFGNIHSWHRWWRWLISMACVSIAAQIGTMPLVAYYFGRIACYGLLANFVVIPLATVMIYLSVGVFLSSFLPFSSLSLLLSKLLSIATNCLNSSLTAIASWPGSSIDMIHLNIAQLLLIYVIEGLVMFVFIYLLQLRKR